MSDLRPAAAGARRDRVDWLDMVRLLAILDILCFHWVRTAEESGRYGLFAMPGYEDTRDGLGHLAYLFPDHTGDAASWLNNIVLALPGLGWEAVNVFVLLSGLGLAMHYRPTASGFSLRTWYRHRFSRILVPFWCIAAVLILAGAVFEHVAAAHGGTLAAMAQRLAAKNLPDPLPVEFLVHAVMFDPRQAGFAPRFFAPCWWFLPPLLIGYLAFPLLWRAMTKLGTRSFLAASFAVSVAGWGCSAGGLLTDHGWYFVIFHELFDFTLGIAIGRFMASPGGRARVTAWLADWRVALAAAAVYAAGNAANWFSPSFPAANAMVTLPLAVLLGALALRLSRVPSLMRICRRVDPFYLYLLHQPLVWPLILGTAAVTGPAARGAGLVPGLLIFVGLAFLVVVSAKRVASILGGTVQHFRLPGPVVRLPT